MTIVISVSATKPNHVCRLVKSLYRLKRASRRWYERLITFIIEHHYKQTTLHHSLFMKVKTSSITILLVYVDDVILADHDLNEFN